MKTPRDEVYAAIDGERDYQDAEFGIRQPSVGQEVDLILVYVSKAIDDPTNVMRNVRKIAGIAVRCMENHGAPKR